jgi:beta-N-acetylhexosaminidase
MSLRDLRRTVGQFVMVGFAGPTVPSELRALARDFDLAGVVLFARNVEEPAQVADLAYEARGLSETTPLWVAVDQEGGRVARLRRAFTVWPPMAALGRAQDVGLVRRFAAAMARELKAVGITFDFAPVLDVLTNPGNPAIGDRALSTDPRLVADYGREIALALQEAGIAASGKHFPGHGDTGVDSHLDLPVVEHPPERFDAVEWVPFRAAIDAGVASIMVGHLLVPAFDERTPASLSAPVVTGQLRGTLGFSGLVLTDDLDMKAVSARVPLERAAVEAIAAGCDIVLACGTDHDQHARLLEAIIYAAEREDLSIPLLDAARARQRRAKERFLSAVAPKPLSAAGLAQVLATPEHAAVAETMAAFV